MTSSFLSLPPEHSRVLAFAMQVHEELWEAWSTLSPATLELHFESGETGFDQSTKILHLRYENGDVADALSDANGTLNRYIKKGWSSLRRDVIHETLHEYQYRVLKTESPEGRRLFDTRPASFSGPGHDVMFYSAIAKWASCFGLSPEELLQDL